MRIIPTEPGFVPSASARERATAVLRRALPLADDIASHVSAEIRFVDCGANFETVRCPYCGADLGEWWAEVMEIGQEQHFRDLRVTTPCCGTASALNRLVYSAPAGFARYVVEVLNPGVDRLPERVKHQLEQVFGSSLRLVWADY